MAEAAQAHVGCYFRKLIVYSRGLDRLTGGFSCERCWVHGYLQPNQSMSVPVCLLLPPSYRAVLCCLEAFNDKPAVTTPLLKFVSEFVYNKSQRLTFDSSSPNGILLFREVSKVLVTYGKHVLTVNTVKDNYNDKYKGIWICLQVCQGLQGQLLSASALIWCLYGIPARSLAAGCCCLSCNR